MKMLGELPSDVHVEDGRVTHRSTPGFEFVPVANLNFFMRKVESHARPFNQCRRPPTKSGT
jgi:hypothetical protein